jgi:hypothetical protein
MKKDLTPPFLFYRYDRLYNFTYLYITLYNLYKKRNFVARIRRYLSIEQDNRSIRSIRK